MRAGRRTFLLLGAAVIVALVFAACGESEVEPTPESDPAAFTQAFVQKAIDRYEDEGREATLAYYSSPASVEGEWYAFILDENGVTIAHVRPEMLGRVHEDRIDVTGYDYGAEFAGANEDGKWVDYVFLNRETNEETLKHTWIVRHDGIYFASGWYEPGA